MHVFEILSKIYTNNHNAEGRNIIAYKEDVLPLRTRYCTISHCVVSCRMCIVHVFMYFCTQHARAQHKRECMHKYAHANMRTCKYANGNIYLYRLNCVRLFGSLTN